MHRALKASWSRRGLTMIEILISTFIFATVLGLVGLTLITGTGTYKQDMQSSNQFSKANSLLDKVTKELTMISIGSLNPNPAPPLGSAVLDFRQLADWAAGAVVLSPTHRIQWQLAPGELNNGIDDNNDGLIDEGAVIMIRDVFGANPTTITLGKNVAEFLEGEIPNGNDDNGNGLDDEAGLSFERPAGEDLLIVRITTQTVGEMGHVTSKTYTTAIKMEVE